jgi:hypothetical protein
MRLVFWTAMAMSLIAAVVSLLRGGRAAQTVARPALVPDA